MNKIIQDSYAMFFLFDAYHFTLAVFNAK